MCVCVCVLTSLYGVCVCVHALASLCVCVRVADVESLVLLWCAAAAGSRPPLLLLLGEHNACGFRRALSPVHMSSLLRQSLNRCWFVLWVGASPLRFVHMYPTYLPTHLRVYASAEPSPFTSPP
jgi:hypothetical protein